MDDLPELCLDRIAQRLCDDVSRLPSWVAAQDAGTYARVSRWFAQTFARPHYDVVDPGCVAAADAAREQDALERALLTSEVEAPVPELPDGLTAKSGVADLRAVCNALGCAATPPRARMWDNAQTCVADKVAKAAVVRRLLDEDPHPVSALLCPVRARVRAYAVVERKEPDAVLTATEARNLGLSDLVGLEIAPANPRHRRYSKLVVLRSLLASKGPDMGRRGRTFGERVAAEMMARRRAAVLQQELRAIGLTPGQAEEPTPQQHDVVVGRYVAGDAKLSDLKTALAGIKAQAERRRVLVAALGALGCELRPESALCANHIHSGHGDPGQIAGVMREMRFFIECTDYPDGGARGYNDHDEVAKNAALEAWVIRGGGGGGGEIPDSLRGKIRCYETRRAVLELFDRTAGVVWDGTASPSTRAHLVAKLRRTYEVIVEDEADVEARWGHSIERDLRAARATWLHEHIVGSICAELHVDADKRDVVLRDIRDIRDIRDMAKDEDVEQLRPRAVAAIAALGSGMTDAALLAWVRRFPSVRSALDALDFAGPVKAKIRQHEARRLVLDLFDRTAASMGLRSSAARPSYAALAFVVPDDDGFDDPARLEALFRGDMLGRLRRERAAATVCDELGVVDPARSAVLLWASDANAKAELDADVFDADGVVPALWRQVIMVRIVATRCPGSDRVMNAWSASQTSVRAVLDSLGRVPEPIKAEVRRQECRRIAHELCHRIASDAALGFDDRAIVAHTAELYGAVAVAVMDDGRRFDDVAHIEASFADHMRASLHYEHVRRLYERVAKEVCLKSDLTTELQAGVIEAAFHGFLLPTNADDAAARSNHLETIWKPRVAAYAAVKMVDFYRVSMRNSEERRRRFDAIRLAVDRGTTAGHVMCPLCCGNRLFVLTGVRSHLYAVHGYTWDRSK